MSPLVKARTLLKLGLRNIVAVIWYRLCLRSPRSVVRRLQHPTPSGAFFAPIDQVVLKPDLQPIHNWSDSGLLFSYIPFPIQEGPPEWLRNPVTKKDVANAQLPWWEIADFDPEVGDIKQIWELSRMDWALAMATRAHTDSPSLDRLNAWLNSWCTTNPPYRGPNWKCGQEASIRIMHVAMAAVMLGQEECSTTTVLSFIQMHLKRIAPTIAYAMAQDNNHGTSEAAALFIGGSWLVKQGDRSGLRWQEQGRKWLENRALKLIGPDGSFSQHSVNYHRVMLDTYIMVEVWRTKLGLAAFSSLFYKRLTSASEWLRHMVQAQSGDAPNLGANDGARLLQLTNTTYRDFRPTVQFASVLFSNGKAYAEDGSWNDALRWLGVPLPDLVLSATKSLSADDGGYAMLRRNKAFVLFRYPRFKFRPSQSDALHIDLWINGENMLRDAGTYSYNTDKRWLSYFGGTESHNTIQFDGRDQMPRISRFLFGNWLKTASFTPLREDSQFVSVAASYLDSAGVTHHRGVEMHDSGLKVTDDISGSFTRAVLRWRLSPGDWTLNTDGVCGNDIQIRITSSAPIERLEITQGYESLHYLEKTTLPVLELEVAASATIVTELNWKT